MLIQILQPLRLLYYGAATASVAAGTVVAVHAHSHSSANAGSKVTASHAQGNGMAEHRGSPIAGFPAAGWPGGAPESMSTDNGSTGNREHHNPGKMPVYLAAELSGGDEIPNANGEATADPDGYALAALRIRGDQVTFAMRWHGIATPTEAHIHVGAAGADGDVAIPLFGAGLPDTAIAVTGSVTVSNTALLNQIEGNPAGFYANIHTAEFPGGAVRGQLHYGPSVDPGHMLYVGGITSTDTGRQELPNPNGEATDDPDGQAIASVRAEGTEIEYSFAWSGIAAPTEGHIHSGAAGMDGPVAVALFSTPNGLPPSVTGIAGAVENVDPQLITAIRVTPSSYYTNLHTAEFPGGAVRGQLVGWGGSVMPSPSSPAPNTMSAPPSTMPTQPSPSTTPTMPSGTTSSTAPAVVPTHW